MATGLAATGRTQASPLVCADQAMVWIVLPDVPFERTATGVRIIHTRADPWFEPRARFPLREGNVYCAAVLRGQLHAFFGDGTYYSFERTEVGRTVPAARSQLQQRLPGGFLPLTVAGNESEDALWAIVPSHIAARILEENRRRDRLLADEEEKAGPAQPSTQPAAEEPQIDPASSAYWLVTYRPRRWEPLEPIGEYFSASVWTAMACRDGNTALVWRPPTTGPAAEMRLVRRFDERWGEPETIPNTASWDALALGWTGDEPTLVGLRSGPQGDAAGVEVLRRRTAGWTSAKLLTADNAALRAIPEQVAAAVCGHQIFLALVEDAENASWGLWPAAGGRPVENIQAIPDLGVPEAPILSGRWGQAVSYVTLVLLLSTAFWRRQASLLTPANLPAGLGPASLARRAAGFLLDFLPALVITAPLVVAAANDALVVYGERPEIFLQKTWLPWLLTRAVYTAYCLIWEWFRAATPGKMTLHTVICSLDGRPCTRGQILVRNLFRIVELELYLLVWPLMLLLVLTRNRQRLGDMWANTLVIQRVPVPPPPRHIDESQA